MLALFSLCDPLHRIVDGSVLKIPNGFIALVTLDAVYDPREPVEKGEPKSPACMADRI